MAWNDNNLVQADRRIRYAAFRYFDGSRGFLLLDPANPGTPKELDGLWARLANGELTSVEELLGFCYVKYCGEDRWIVHEELGYRDFDLSGAPAANGKLAALLKEQQEYAEEDYAFVSNVCAFYGPKIPRDWYGDYNGHSKDYRPNCHPLTGE
jgi:hypothetical protein